MEKEKKNLKSKVDTYDMKRNEEASLLYCEYVFDCFDIIYLFYLIIIHDSSICIHIRVGYCYPIINNIVIIIYVDVCFCPLIQYISNILCTAKRMKRYKYRIVLRQNKVGVFLLYYFHFLFVEFPSH